MKLRYSSTITAVIASTLLVSACTGSPKTPTTSTTAPPNASAPADDVPKVSNPLPATVLDGSPCDSALTNDQLSGFLGKSTPAAPQENSLGTMCQWSSASGTGAGITVTYQTKSDKGLALAYQNVQPKAARWKVLDPIQDYPAIAYSDFDDKRAGVIVVGVTDSLAYSVSLTLGDKAASENKDAFDLGPQVADAVMTNLKARA